MGYDSSHGLRKRNEMSLMSLARRTYGITSGHGKAPWRQWTLKMRLAHVRGPLASVDAEDVRDARQMPLASVDTEDARSTRQRPPGVGGR